MPSGKNVWLTFLTFDLLIKIVILHALLAATMTNILLVNQEAVVTSLYMDGLSNSVPWSSRGYQRKSW